MSKYNFMKLNTKKTSSANVTELVQKWSYIKELSIKDTLPVHQERCQDVRQQSRSLHPYMTKPLCQ